MKNNSVNAFLNDDLLTENGLAGGFLTSQKVVDFQVLVI
jgi:hypothetical protein